MKLLDDSVGFKEIAEHCVAAIGVFDGIHHGHQKIIRKAVEKASVLKVPSVVFTFKRNPSESITGKHPCVLAPYKLKTEILEELNVDCMISIDFNERFASLEPDKFCENILSGDLGALCICVGEDFHFGKGGGGDAGTLREEGKRLGFEVEIIPLVYVEESKLSSTLLREMIKEGNVADVKEGLGRPFTLRGHIIHGHSRGKRLGFPTANLSLELDYCVPADGVYAGVASLEGEKYRCAINIGDNPTFGDAVKALEVFLLDFVGEVYGETIEIEFYHRLRDEITFADEKELVLQMNKDVEQTRNLLG